MFRYLIVDGMFHGTGLRDGAEGGFIDQSVLDLPNEFLLRLNSWLGRYESEHLNGFTNLEAVRGLDETGFKIASTLAKLLPESKITYCSAATMKKTIITS